MVFSEYKKQRILYYDMKGYRAPTIRRLLREEKLDASRVGIAKFLKKVKATGSISRTPSSGRPSKITGEMKEIVEAKMREDDETTASQLHALLEAKATRGEGSREVFSRPWRQVILCFTPYTPYNSSWPSVFPQYKVLA